MSILKVLLLFVLFNFAISVGQSDIFALSSNTPIATEIFVTDAGGFQIQFTQFVKSDDKYRMIIYNLPAEEHMLNIAPLDVHQCEVTTTNAENITRALSTITSSDSESISQAYFDPYLTNYLLIHKPHSVLFFAKKGPKAEITGSDKAYNLDTLFQSELKNCRIISPSFSYAQRIELLKDILNENVEIPELEKLRPSLVKGLIAIGVWDIKYLKDANPSVRQVVVGSLDSFYSPFARAWVEIALDDIDADVVSMALLAIDKFPKDRKDVALKEKIKQVTKKRQDDNSGSLGKAMGYRFPIREISENVLKKW